MDRFAAGDFPQYGGDAFYCVHSHSDYIVPVVDWAIGEKVEPGRRGADMSLLGWLIMISAVGGTTCFFAWCISRVMGSPGSKDHAHSSTDVDLPDE